MTAAKTALIGSALALLAVEGVAYRSNGRLLGWQSGVFVAAAVLWMIAALRWPVRTWLAVLVSFASGAVDGTIFSFWSYLHLTLLPIGPLAAISATVPVRRRRAALAAVAFVAGFAVIYFGSRTLGIGGPQGPASAVQPGATSLSGRVIRLVANGVVVDAAGREAEVRLSSVVEVWKEATVPASALEVGDDLVVDGVAGSPFVAIHVYANIGRIDGVIRAIDQTGMLVDVQLRGGGTTAMRIDFSPYVEYGAPGANLPLTRADLVVGRTISAVTYRPQAGPLRATRIW